MPVMSSASSPTAIYPFNRLAWLLWALFMTLLAVFSLSGLSDPSDTPGDKAAFVGMFLFFGALTLVPWRQVVSRRPVMRVDEDGLECRHGRLSWREVERVLVVHGQSGEWTWSCLLVVGTRGAGLLTPANRYFEGWVWKWNWEERKLGKRLPATSYPALAIGLAACSKRVFAALDRYYAGSVGVIPAASLTAELGRF